MGPSIIDISSRSKVPLERALSNFASYAFIYGGTECNSMEGFLQSLKFRERDEQHRIAKLTGYQAWKAGQETGNVWVTNQVLFWREEPIGRNSSRYDWLITGAYDALFDQSEQFRAALKQSIGQRLAHSMGKHDPMKTLLTEREYIDQLNRLRWKHLESHDD